MFLHAVTCSNTGLSSINILYVLETVTYYIVKITCESLMEYEDSFRKSNRFCFQDYRSGDTARTVALSRSYKVWMPLKVAMDKDILKIWLTFVG